MGRGVRISAEARDEILARLKAGASSADLALEYELSVQTIRKYLRRFSGNIFKSPRAPKRPRAPTVPACEFVEIGLSSLEDSMLLKRSVPVRLEISVKFGENSLSFDIAPCNQRLDLIFKLIGSLC